MFGDRKNNLQRQINRRRVILDGRTPIQALMDEIKFDKLYRALECSYEGCVKRLFFAQLDSLALAKQFRSVLLLYCTYKTNRFACR